MNSPEKLDNNSASPDNKIGQSFNFSKFFKNSAVFGIGIAIPKVVGLLLLPLYTNYLSPKDYGVLGLLEFVSINFSIVIGAGFSQALLRFYYDKEDQHWRDSAFCSCLLVVAVFGVLGLGVGILAAPIISDMLLHSVEFSLAVALILGTSFINATNTICFTLLRVQERVVCFVSITLTLFAVSVVLNVYCIAYLGLGIMGFVLSGIISAALGFFIFGVFVIFPHRALPNIALVKEMFTFSMPYIPSGFFAAFVPNMGLICLTMIGDLIGAGLFAVGRKLGSAISLLSQPFGMVWTPYMFKVRLEPEAPRIYAVGTTYLIVFLSFAVLFLVAIIKDLIAIIADEQFFDAYRVVLPIALGALASTLGPTLRIGIAIAKKTGYIPLTTAAGILIGFPLTYILTRNFGVLGAAWGTAGTWFLIAGFIVVVSRRFLIVPYEYSRLLRIIIVIALCLFAIQLLESSLIWARLAIVACFLPALWVVGILTVEERAAISAATSRFLAMIMSRK